MLGCIHVQGKSMSRFTGLSPCTMCGGKVEEHPDVWVPPHHERRDMRWQPLPWRILRAFWGVSSHVIATGGQVGPVFWLREIVVKHVGILPPVGSLVLLERIHRQGFWIANQNGKELADVRACNLGYRAHCKGGNGLFIRHEYRPRGAYCPVVFCARAVIHHI